MDELHRNSKPDSEKRAGNDEPVAVNSQWLGSERQPGKVCYGRPPIDRLCGRRRSGFARDSGG